MSDRQKLIKARMGMLALAEELNNISAACRRAGISRSHYYEIKDAFEKFGADGLAPQPRRKPRMPNQTPPETEAQILEMTERYPTYSYLRISGQLKLIGIGVSPAAVRAVWQRHGLTLRVQRLLWLEHKTAAAGGVLTDRQIRLLHKHRSRTADPEQHVDAPYPGYLLCQDTYFVGTIKGVGKIYMQSVVDAHCSLGFAKLYLSKVPMTAVDVLHDRVFPFLENYDVDPEHILTDNGREFCGRELKHHYELFLAIHQVQHRRTEVRSPQTNGFCERFHRTVKEEFFATAFRKTLYETVAQLQTDLDRFLDFYNRERAHHGYRTQGRTPFQAFLDGLALRPSQKEAA
jgi:transposase InsO family protein